MLYRTDAYDIYFGNAHDQLSLPTEHIMQHASLRTIQQTMNLYTVVFVKQIHSAQGIVIDTHTPDLLNSFVHEGDFIITNQKNIGIGVLTADCLPIVLYDQVHQSVAIVHAGWRGTVRSIAQKAVQALQENFHTQPQDLKVFFGPSAQRCCYSVGEEVIKQIESFSFAQETMHEHNGAMFFDVVACNKFMLSELGVPQDAFSERYAQCTICNDTFFSYRREKSKSGRQCTVVALK
jgi:polyphenol oxidase